jgi:hypothetical protein
MTEDHNTGTQERTPVATLKQRFQRVYHHYPELQSYLKHFNELELNKVNSYKFTNKDREHEVILEDPSYGYPGSSVAFAYYLKHGFIGITFVTTSQLLDSYLNISPEVTPLNQIQDDLVIIIDTRAQVPNKQKTNLIAQVMTNNSHVILVYRGTLTAYESEHQTLKSLIPDLRVSSPMTNTIGNFKDSDESEFDNI